MANKIYVGNLPISITEKELFELFVPFGEVISAQITMGMDGKTNSGYGYVMMVNDKDMQKAILKLNNSLYKKRNIRVVKAHPIDQDSGYLARKNRFSRYNKFSKFKRK
ncbi:hypothetical protein A2767_01185 [Candidatus Roizmanbacteria bacterium RIFCSPHIGHO2_01_FULL_35_10]|uniref:RRM domain-containing protein n=1 Tax=Candidatus Roizmanbacteria bacterium RIFCSPLOWO2_01_FULL_35_13 TaxID=1802055 RepID=A0A1F7IC11_9BACT|nr:MAG: hypothetical protein A2767_01185 [Candidatus Roizmanbacteria bacterium RIFCSPHIGHO2_01_FULL_35_10]OGK40895.1 MAG: hypothetical protein A3A74_01555 [Candidatus Roizmanbacteria bacterium RIFCSPLOWO2_01_FULL_35_13]